LKDGIGEAALEYAKCLASAVPTALAPFDHLFGRRMPTGLGECAALNSPSPSKRWRKRSPSSPDSWRRRCWSYRVKVIASFPSCPIPEVARLGRTLKAWRQQLLAYFDTSDVSNGGTEAINLIIEKVRRLAHRFKDFTHYRLQILLAAPGNRAYRK
jgi:Transposase